MKLVIRGLGVRAMKLTRSTLVGASNFVSPILGGQAPLGTLGSPHRLLDKNLISYISYLDRYRCVNIDPTPSCLRT